MSDTLAAIREFAELSLRRHRGALPQEDRARLELLEDQLRDAIDGAHPAPRRIENPGAASAPARVNAGVAPAAVSVTRSNGNVANGGAPSIAPAAPAAAKAPRIELSESVRSKLQEVQTAEIGASSYTPSTSPPYLDDYFSGGLTLPADASLLGSPARVVSSDGEAAPISAEAIALLGVPTEQGGRLPERLRPARPIVESTRAPGGGEGALARIQLKSVAAREAARPAAAAGGISVMPASAVAPARPSAPPPPPSAARPPAGAPPAAARVAPAAPSIAARPSAPPPTRPSGASPARTAASFESGEEATVAAVESASPAPAGAPPAVVHLLSGASKRGELTAFSPAAGDVRIRTSGVEEAVEVSEIFAIFVGLSKAGAPLAATGTRIAVKLLNGKELTGHSPDYAPGAAAMTLVPDDRRNVDRVWIPAWSVSEIRLA
ncbi:MAG: hypothetical protein IT384_08675 [Deltaproteobacteria bacterium]|nr:hypothetical protein [Deltaproteobacteria bacterium]